MTSRAVLAPPIASWVFFLQLLLVLPAAAAADETGLRAPVIPPGQDSVIHRLVGMGETLAAGCRLSSGRIQNGWILATYTCAEDDVVVELREPSQAAAAVGLTQKFAISVRAGTPPPGFIDDLLTRVRTHEPGFHWLWIDGPRPMEVRLHSLLLGAWWIVAGLAMLLVGRASWRAWRRAPGAFRGNSWKGSTIRLLGVAGIVAVTIHGSLLRGDSSIWIPGGIAAVTGVLWLTATGFFGYANTRRADRPALLIAAAGLLVREGFTLHSIQEVEIHFPQGAVGLHSVVHPLLQLFFEPLAREAHRLLMHVNGILGALAVLPLYLFVRQRTGAPDIAWAVAWLFATHPLVVRFAPTDSPYSMLFVTWFSALALLSATPLTSKALCGGTILLGLAASTRLEGIVFVAATLCLLSPRALWLAIRRDPLAASFAAAALFALGMVQIRFLLPFFLNRPTSFESQFHILEHLPSSAEVLGDALWPARFNGRGFGFLLLAGVCAGIGRPYRLAWMGLGATALVVAPVTGSAELGYALHRIVPTCAMQAIVAGVGLAALLAWAQRMGISSWAARLASATVAAGLLAGSWGTLNEPYVFTEEYDMVRHHLAPRGQPLPECTLLTLNEGVHADIDIHTFRQVLPGAPVIDCHGHDCIAKAAQGGCFHYIRSAACYFHAGGLPANCRGVDEGVGVECLNEACRRLENALTLRPMEERTIDLTRTYPDLAANYPARARIGLFRVTAAASR